MQTSYMPKATTQEFCEGLNLCSVRKTSEGVQQIGIKLLSGEIKEEILENILNLETYNGKNIIRTYASGHIFLSEDKKQVYLVTTEKEGKIQHQFTGGSPLEQENKEVIFKENDVYKFDIEKVRNNARIRTQNRTGVKIIEEYNEKPLVDWALMENEEAGEIYYKIVCLMHFIVKKYDGIINPTGQEYAVSGAWFDIEDLLKTPNVAPNAYIVSKKSVEIINEL